MDTLKLFNEIVSDIYEASYRPDHWVAVLDKICAITKSRSALMAYQDTDSSVPALVYHCHIPEGLLDDYYKQPDPGYELFGNANRIGQTIREQDLIPDPDELRAYHEKHGVLAYREKWDYPYTAVNVVFNDETRVTGIALHRRLKQGLWSDQELAFLDNLAPHIQRSLHIHREFSRLQGQERALSTGLNRMVMGVILFDEFLQPVFLNDIAKELMESHPAISLSGEQLICENSDDTSSIREALTRAVTPRHHSESTSTALGLSHPDKMIPLPILITPLSQTDMAHLIPNPGHYVAVLLNDPEKNQPIVPEALRTAYGLTLAEARVAIGIANGMSQHEIAALHNVKDITIKSQLKSIYRKLGIRRQTELVKLLLTGPFRVNF